ncbi:MAG TPA: protein-disulfide reductase DsbD [Steroidobacteraceae bacterium]
MNQLRIIALLGMLLAGPGVTLQAAAAPGSTLNDVIKASQTSNDNDFLLPDVAFQVEAAADGPDRVRISWKIADGYYLYRERMKASVTSDKGQAGDLALPNGESKTDDLGQHQVYHHEVVATLPVARSAGGPVELPVKVSYQGCAEAGLCYSPMTKTLNVTLPAGSGSSLSSSNLSKPDGSAAAAAGGSASGSGSVSGNSSTSAGYVSEQDRFADVIKNASLFWVIVVSLGAGIALSFTPCVLPMIPIVSGLIIGDGTRAVTTRRSFLLSLSYVLGMALAYTAAGMAVGASGKQFQAALQQPWVIVPFSLVFVVLALAMFGLFTLQMPSAVQTRLTAISNQQSGGTFGGAAIMGALSSLIVTTCVAPVLVGVLLVIGQSGGVLRGGVALFSMGLGMGVPLLAVGASAGTLLPRPGAWMDLIKQLFGAMMLSVTAWLLSRVIPERFSLFLWAIPLTSAAVVLWIGAGKVRSNKWLVRFAGAAFTAWAAMMITGGAMGNTDALSPLSKGDSNQLAFRTIKSVDDLKRAVTAANVQGKAVLLDFYADWCVSCKEMEKFTFTDAHVKTALNGTVLLRADVTANDADDQALLKHFGIFGPPTIAFYGVDGQEQKRFRVVGYMKAPDFASVAQSATGKAASAPAT